MKKPIVIRNLECRPAEMGWHRCSAMVDGHETWFESELQTSPHPESHLSAFLLSAMAAGRNLQTDAAVDPVWLQNNSRLQDIFHRWWGYPKIRIDAPIAPSTLPRPSKTAALFTAGVDSFHTLLHHPRQIDALMFIEGLDVKIDHVEYRRHTRELIRNIARARRVEFISIATNLRKHPLFRKMDYMNSHGGAMAACAHQLSGHIGHLIINSSSVTDYNVPLGTHWESDPLWSSSALEVEHWGQHLWRSEKLGQIMHEPIVRANLRVCFETLQAPRLNCCRCEKCVRTMLSLHQRGELDDFTSLQPPVSLVDSIDRILQLRGVSVPVYENHFLVKEPDPAVRAALERLIHRSKGPLRKIRRLAYKWRLRMRRSG